MLEAMLGCVGEQGYLPTVVADVIAKAVASRKTFYEHFEDRQTCLLALSDEIGAEWERRVSAACERAEEQEASIVEALVAELFALGCERPAALRLFAVELSAAGSAGMSRRERLLDRLAEPLLAGLGEDPSAVLLAHSMAGAMLRVLYARARKGAGVRRPRRGVVEQLVDSISGWASRYADGGELPLLAPAGDRNDAGESAAGGRAPGTLSLSS